MSDWHYSKTEDNSSRFTLGPKISDGRILYCFGINPSTAHPEKLDNTVSSVKRIASRHSFDAFLMLNLYPQRATNPKDMHDEMNREIHELNLIEIDKILALNKDPTILVAWGTIIKMRSYLRDCLFDIYKICNKHNAKFMCIGNITKEGHPHHPLYLSNSEMMKEFDMERYVDSFNFQ